MSQLSKHSAFVQIKGTVIRQRLFERMLLGPPQAARTTVLVAPAGFGKTTLLAQIAEHLRSCNFLPIWLNCDRQDRQPNQFLKSLDQAYQSATGITDSQIVDVLSGISENGQSIAFFIDEYDVAACPAIDQLLLEFTRSLGSSARLFIGCRSTPSIDLTTLALHGVARQVNASELRFSTDEMRDLFENTLDNEELLQVSEVTDGWAVVLQLIKLASPSGNGTSLLGQDGKLLPTGMIFSYLASEVWGRLPEELRDFMESTCPLPYIDIPSANWIRSRSDSASFINRLSELHPIVSVDSRAIEARIHPLLRGFLVHQLMSRDVYALPLLHRRAAEYFEGRNAIFDAVSHALQADDVLLAVKVIERAGGLRLAATEGMGYVKNLLSLLPETAIQACPRIQMMQICASIVDDNPIETKYLLDNLESSLLTSGDICESNPVWIDLLFARGAETLGLGERSINYDPWERLKELKDKALLLINEDPRLLGIVSIVEILHTQRWLDCIKSELRTEALGQLNSRYRLVANNIWHPLYKAQNDYHAGRLLSAERHLRGMLAKEFDLFHSQQSVFGHMTYALLGRVHYAKGELEEAMTCFEHIGEDSISPFLEVAEGAIICRAFCETASGHPEVAIERLYRELLRVREQNRPTCACLINATRVEILCRAGRIEEAAQVYTELASELRDNGVDENQVFGGLPWCIIHGLARARFYLAMANDDPHAAAEVATSLQQAARDQRRIIGEVTAGALLAEATLVSGKHQNATKMLIELLSQCRQPPPAQVFLEHGARLTPILGRIAESEGRGSSIASTILRIWEREFGAYLAVLNVLSQRESEVLVQLSRKQSTKQIARSLALSPETIKFHLKSIFTKLGVNTREAAVEEAYQRVLMIHSLGSQR